MVDLKKAFAKIGVQMAKQTEVNGEKVPYRQLNEGETRKVHSFNSMSNPHIFQLGMSAQDIVDHSRINQVPINTLCGQSLVADVDPFGLEACADCYEIAKILKKGY